MLILKHIDLVSRISKDKYIREFLVDNALEQLKDLDDFVDEYWIRNRNRLYGKPMEQEIRILNYITSCLNVAPIELSSDIVQKKGAITAVT